MKNKNVLIEIWNKIPLWYKNLVLGGIILTVLKLLFTKFLNGEDIIFTNELRIVFWVTIVLIVIGFYIGLLRVINEVLNVQVNIQSPDIEKNLETKRKKIIPDFWKLETINVNEIEYSIRAFRCFSVDDIPDVETFLQSIRIIPVNCSSCKNELSYVPDNSTRTPNYVWTCNNKTCDNYFKVRFAKHKFDELIEQLKLQTTSKIKKNFKEYWNKYCEIYKKFSDGKYEDFDTIRYLGDIEFYFKT